MNTNRKTAIIVGVLFVIATIAGVLSVVLLEPILNSPDYLINISANSTPLIIVVLLDLIMVTAIVSIPIFLFPILKKQNENIALGYVIFRIFEVIPLLFGAISLLLLLTLSKEFAIVGVMDAPQFQTLGTLLLAAGNWSTLVGGQIIFSLTALILNYSFYQSKLIPRWLSGWGLIGVPLMLASGVLGLFVGTFSSIGTMLIIPLALQEMVFAVWLIVKGFNSSAIDSDFVKGEKQ